MDEKLLGISKKIGIILEKVVGLEFKSERSEFGRAVIMRFISANRSWVNKAQKLLFRELNLPRQRKETRHGSAGKMMILIPLHELGDDCIKRIEEKFGKVIAQDRRKAPKTDTTLIVPARQKTLSSPEQPRVSDKASTGDSTQHHLVINYRSSVSKFLSAAFGFEGITRKDVFKYTGKKQDKLLELVCKDEQIADGVFIALRWFLGSPDLVGIDGKTVIAECSKWTGVREEWKSGRRVGVQFCFSPKQGSTKNDVKKRLLRAIKTSKPRVYKIRKGVFQAQYFLRKRNPREIAEILKSMGWAVGLKDSFLEISVGVGPVSEKKKVKVVAPGVSSGFSPDLSDPEKELKELMSSPELWAKLSDKTRERIRLHFLEKDPEAYARELLARLQK